MRFDHDKLKPQDGGVVFAFDSHSVLLLDTTVTGSSAAMGVTEPRTDGGEPKLPTQLGGAMYLYDTDLIVASSTLSSCRARKGGAVYMLSGTASLTMSNITNCNASESGGGLYSAGGRTTLSNGSLISGCSAPEGRSLFLQRGDVAYTLPAPAGRWLPNARCEIYRDAEGQPTFVQPCNWNNEYGGDPSLLGQSLYQLPLIPVEQDFPYPCAAGLSGSTDREDQSSSACGGPCPAGTSSAKGSGSCVECKPSFYAANRGQGECLPCPYPLSSDSDRVICAACMEGFYLLASDADPAAIFRAPTEHCKPCPPNAKCSLPDTTLTSLGVPAGFWRASLSSAVLTECRSFGVGSGAGKKRCAGSRPAAGDLLVTEPGSGDIGSVEASSGEAGSGDALADGADSRRMLEEADLYCAPGFYGPECQLCAAPDHHLVDGDRCKQCLAVRTAAGQITALAIGICIVCGLAWAAFKMESWRRKRCLGPLLRLADRAVTFSAAIGLIPKFKILLGFYQICIVLSTTYSARLPERYTSWTDKVNDAVSIDWSGFFLPPQCLPYRSRLVAVSIAPVGVIVLLLLAGVGLRLHQRRLAPTPRPLPWHAEAALGLLDLTPASLFLVFCFVPSVSAFIFRAWSCQALRSAVLPFA